MVTVIMPFPALALATVYFADPSAWFALAPVGQGFMSSKGGMNEETNRARLDLSRSLISNRDH
jgi:hypothetical protein